MPLTTLGEYLTHKVLATADFTFTPQEPFAAIVNRILVTGVSANDNWVLTVNGKELARFRILTVGNQQLLGGSDANYPKSFDLFRYVEDRLGIPIVYPVMQGATLELKSVGGATADVLAEYQECNPAELTTNMLNHPQGNHFIVPFYAYINASLSAAAEVPFDTEVKPAWMPSLFIENGLVAGWQYRILALFSDGAGVNTFSGSANHASVTDHLYLLKSGQRMFSRDAGDGLPVVGVASAAGSANTVYGSRLASLHGFQQQTPWSLDAYDTPFNVKVGENMVWGLGIAGDLTGGADYSKALTVALVDVYQTGA